MLGWVWEVVVEAFGPILHVLDETLRQVAREATIDMVLRAQQRFGVPLGTSSPARSEILIKEIGLTSISGRDFIGFQTNSTYWPSIVNALDQCKVSQPSCGG